MISGYRGNNGLPAVTVDPELMRLASEQAHAMAAHDKMDHDIGRPFQERIRNSGFRGRVAVENISAGYHTLAEAFSGWRDSPPHRANMLNRQRHPHGHRRGLCAEVEIQGVLGAGARWARRIAGSGERECSSLRDASEAIQGRLRRRLDCFVASLLAMTTDAFSRDGG